MFTNQSNSNYTAKIIRCGEVSPIDGADSIATIIVDYRTVVVAKTTDPKETRIYFPPESQLSHKLLSKLNEYRVDNNKDNLNENVVSKGGFFEENRRVKVIKLRGVKSNGYTIPAVDFAKVYGILVEDIEANIGEYFDTVNGELVCNKYIVPVKQSGSQKTGKQKPKLTRLVEGQFQFHSDTANLRRSMTELNKDDNIVIHNKLHGTSWIVSNVLVKRQLSILDRIAAFFGVSVQTTEYDHLAASRKVVKNRYMEDPKNTSDGFYGFDLWGYIKDEVKTKVPKGYSIYGEAVGYLPNSAQMIQKGFDYGCKPGEYKLSVYRVTLTNADGLVTELNNFQVERFCANYGFDMSQKFYEGTVEGFLALHRTDDVLDWKVAFVSKLEELYNEKKCHLCTFHKVPEEGVVVRVLNRPTFTAYKCKSQAFLFMEKENNNNNVIDIESLIE